MNSSDATNGSAIQLATPPVTNPVDAEVDLEVLRMVPKTFEIKDETTANWLVRKIVAARQYAEAVKAWADRERRRAEREEQTLLYLYGRQIEVWARGEVAKLEGRRKSVILPAGLVGFRRVNASLQVDDESIVLRWAKEHCTSAVVISERLSKTELKTHFEKTGEVPDEGVHLEPEREQFYVR